MTDAAASSSSRGPQSAQGGASIRLLMEKIVFRNPDAIVESSVELLRHLAASFGKIIDETEFDSLLACAAYRAKVDLSTLQHDRRSGHACPGCVERQRDFGAHDKEKIALETLRRLDTVVALFTSLIGEHLAFQQFQDALDAIDGSNARIDSEPQALRARQRCGVPGVRAGEGARTGLRPTGG